MALRRKDWITLGQRFFGTDELITAARTAQIRTLKTGFGDRIQFCGFQAI
jgi:hypothetical protein